MNPSLLSLKAMASSFFANTSETNTPESIRALIATLRGTPMFNGSVSDEEAEALARKIEETQGVSMGIGAIIGVKDFKPWLRDARINQLFENYYWDRYKRLLQSKGMSNSVVVSTDEVTEKILDRMGNPAETGSWNRRGMVVGHVQSGKTSNYTGLICKAADAGYRLIVVIAGIHNNLRNQTQARIDEGFIGIDTGRLTSGNKARKQRHIGVGRFDQSRSPVSLTNTLKDFNKATATTNTSQIAHYKEPVVLVIKKNSSTLKNLLEWLQENSANTNTQMVSQPMLLIDDEADNASINTAYGREEITRINGQIRELLSMFHRSCYVGYTATPFANILIDPDSQDDKVKRDLFPRDFIIGLDAPSNYFGAQKIFVDNRDLHVRDITDNDPYLPLKHRKDITVDELPPSLLEAIRAFIVSRAIRNHRGQKASHASMLVNVSRFTDVQGNVRLRITDYVKKIEDAVLVHAGKGTAALNNVVIQTLHDTYQKEYGAVSDVTWRDIIYHLQEVTAGLKVVEVNASQRSEALDYDNTGEHGVTVIAVGGFSLSRGLTLEGLTVSYFLRNSVMYDTLMQMGRWFGYRPGYEDLCRVWMQSEGADWYAHIHEAMLDVQRQLKSMERVHATPEDFGLEVRSHPQALMVTAKNKMGSGKEYPVEVNFSGQRVESSALSTVSSVNERNIIAAERLLGAMYASAQSVTVARGTLYKGVDVNDVLAFLRTFKTHEADFIGNTDLISKYIGERVGELGSWDVCIASSSSSHVLPVPLGDTLLKPFERKVSAADLREGVYSIGGANRRIGSPGEDTIGMTEAELEKARAAFEEEFPGKVKPKSIPDSIYRLARTNPLIILRYVAPLDEGIDGSDRKPLGVPELMTWSMFFPGSRVRGGKTSYVMNTVRMRELFGSLEDDTDEDASIDV